MKYVILLVYLLFSYSSLYAEISVIPEREYFATLQELIAGAESSIEVEMYLVYSEKAQVKELLDEIIEAKERGVRVNILLEDSQEENKEALEYLRERGVVARFDGPDIKLHAKLILVDGKKLVIGSSNWTNCAFTKNNESNVMVDLEEDKDKIEILRDDYADRLLRAIDNAEKEIDIIIYSFQFGHGEESKNYDLMKALLQANDRGVDIKIVMDSWSEWESRNEPAYEILEQAGVEVYYDLDTVASHNKLVVIDNEIVVLGSANWTVTGLTKNREASILIRDPPTSQVYKTYIDKLITNLPEKNEVKVSIPISFIKGNGLFRRLQRIGNPDAIKLYCWFMWEVFTKEIFSFKIDYKRWYEAIYDNPALPWSKSKNRHISYLIHRLKNEGGIKIKNKENEIIFVDHINVIEGWKDTNCIFVPEEFWTFGWIRKLSGRGIYFYLMNLSEFKKSPYKPVWINSQKNLTEEYGMTDRSIGRAIKELMQYNLIEVIHDIPDPGQAFWERKANRYFINPLWSEEELELEWKKLAQRHGQDLFGKARDLATKINESCDSKIVGSFIALLKMYGEKAVSEAVDIATSRSFANGKWELRYIIGILQKDTPLKNIQK